MTHGSAGAKTTHIGERELILLDNWRGRLMLPAVCQLRLKDSDAFIGMFFLPKVP
jgi:hypothetical protein